MSFSPRAAGADDRVDASRQRQAATLEVIVENIPAILDNLPVMVSVFDSAGRLLHANRHWQRVSGWTLEEARQVDLLAHSYPDPAEREQVRRVMQSAEQGWVDFRARARDGRPVDVSTTRLRLDDGSIIGISIDISERKAAEADRDRLLDSERRARTDAEQTLERLRAIQSITDSALAHLSLDELLQELLIRLRRALETDFATVLLLAEDRQSLYLRAVDGYERAPSLRVPLGTGVSGWIAQQGRPLIVDDYSTIDASAYEGVSAAYIREQVESVMGAPLRVGDEVIGVVLVCSRRTRRFTDADLALLLLVADRAAPAVERAHLLETIDKGRQDLENLSRRLLAAQEEERRRLAVELHDELGQILTAIRINLDSKRQSAAGADLADAIDSVDQAMDRVRNLALALRPSVLDDLGLAAALRWYLDRFARETGADAHISIDVVAKLDPVVEITCFRIAQESLTNVVRHARARHVWFDLCLVGDRLELSVRDDGVGFDPVAVRARTLYGASLGLLGMQERASLAGGRVDVSSVPGAGTEVRAWLPVPIGASAPA